MDRAPQTSPLDRVAATYITLRDLIIEGRLAPGSRVIESDLAERLGVSRTPVRSALHRLLQEGYMTEAEGGRRARLIVAPLTREDANELLYILGQVNSLAGFYAAGLAPETRSKLTRRMRAVNSALEKLGKRPDSHRFHDLDEDFHQSYVDAAAGPRLKALNASIQPQADRYIRLYVSALAGQVGVSVAEHEVITDRIDRGLAAAAQKAIQDNWRNAAKRLAEVIEVLGERGQW